MTEAEPLTQQHLEVYRVSRRIAVRELRAKGWRTRAVYHMREGSTDHPQVSLNSATHPRNKLQGDNVFTLLQLILLFFRCGASPAIWKRDISSAFRRVPLRQLHAFLYAVVWAASGQLWLARHLGCPFGAVASV